MLRVGFQWGPWLAAISLVARISAGQPDRAATPEREATREPAAPAVTRPVPKGPFAVPYPEGESREATVVLELVVNREGAVTDARVVEGEEPFAGAALGAAQTFRFEPARRGDEPIVARIRMEVRFVPPEPSDEAPAGAAEPPSEPGSAPPRSPDTKVAPPSAPIEIIVLGEHPPPARMTLGRAEVRELPGAFGDPFRAVEVFPGVTPIVTGVPFFYVRGAPPGNVGYFLDGIRVPLLYHVALGPSVIHPGLVDRVDIYSGGYPARHGRFAGAMVAAETTPPRQRFRGEANVRIFDAGALVEAPFAGGRGSALVGGRYSYTAAALSLFAPEVTLNYWDYQARLSYDLNERWRVGAFAFGAYDLFRADEEDSSVGTQFHRVDLRLDHTPNPATRMRFAVTAGVDRSGAEEGNSDDSDDPTLLDELLGARFELEHQVDRKTLVRAGADANVDRYSIVDVDDESGEGSESAAELFTSRYDVTAGVRADVVWKPEPGVTVTPGLRADFYASLPDTAFALDPRIAAEFALSRHVTLEHTFGVAHQPPSFIVPIPGFNISDLKDGLQQSLQSSAGVVVRPGDGFQFGLTLFHNVFLNLTDFLGTLALRDQSFDAESDERLDIRSRGQAYGLELIAKRSFTRRIGFHVAYTLSRSTRMLRGRVAPASFDRTHVLHTALGFDLGNNWRSGARLSFYTGAPSQTDHDAIEFEPVRAIAVPASRRGPPFYRLDLRLEKRWLIDREGRYWAFVIEMLNATLNKEVPVLTCRSSGCEGEAIGPVTVPSIGGEVFF